MAGLTYLDHIHNLALCSVRIKYYLVGITRDQFEEDPKTRDAVRYCLYIMGKSLEGITNKILKEYPGFPPWLKLVLCLDGGYGEDELWDVLKDSEVGVMRYFNKFERMYELELLSTSEAEKQKLKLFTTFEDKVATKKDLSLDTNYKYPVTTKRSIWTVKKK
jgi:hypothetical protein